jgi:branched-chain amino acid transport system substrate-binding protein
MNFNRRQMLKGVGAGTLAALSGCSDSGSSDGETVGEPRLEDAIKLGILAPYPEDYTVGVDLVNAVNLAADQHNDAGGILGTEFETVVANTKMAPATAREEHRRLTFEEESDLTIGVWLGIVLQSMMESMAQQETLHITAGSAENQPIDLINEDYERYKYHFRSHMNMDHALAATNQFTEFAADKYGWERAAVITEDLEVLDPLGEPYVNEISDYLDVPVFERTSTGQTDWNPLWDRLENADVDVALVFLVITGVTAVAQWAKQERDFQMGGMHVPSMVSEFWEETDGLCEGLFAMNLVTPQTANTPRTQPFVQDYKDEFGFVPGAHTAGAGYDTVNLYAQALRAVGSRNPDDLIPHLEEMVFTDGVMQDRIDFYDKDEKWPHDPKWESWSTTGLPVFFQWQKADNERGGAMECVAPTQYQTAEFQQPPWLRD